MNEIEQVERVCSETEGLTVGSAIKEALVLDLKPIADRLSGYEAIASGAVCRTSDDAATLTGVLANIDLDLKSVEACDVLAKITDGLHKLHRKWTGLRGLFVDPLKASKRTIRDAIVAYQTEQQRIAEERQRKLQAEADEKARKERERLEAQSAKYKTPEKQAAKLEEAAAVIAPTVTVTAQKFIGTRKVWTVQSYDTEVMCAAVAGNPSIAGFLTVNVTALQRAKAANPSMTVTGVVFEHVTK